MSENRIYDNLNGHFGEQLAARIYACAIIMRDSTEKLSNADDETAIRFTIGALKRRRLQGGYAVMTWSEAVEKLENEQDEGRHYGMTQFVDMDIERIEAINRNESPKAVDKAMAQAKAASRLAYALQAEHDRYNADPVEQATIKQWAADYMAALSRTQLRFIKRVLADVKVGLNVAPADSHNIGKRYAPKGVKVAEFVELLVRYTA